MNSGADQITILLADDHPLVLRGIADLLKSEQDLDVVATCSSGTEALDRIRVLLPDVAVLDVAMPGLTGVEVVQRMGEEQLRTRAILLTAAASDANIDDAVAAELWGLVLKDAAPDQLVQAVRTVCAGQRYLAPELIEPALTRAAERRIAGERIRQRITAREREVALLVEEGRSNKEIGRELGLSDGTVKIHLHNIFQKLGVPSRQALAALIASCKEQLRK